MMEASGYEIVGIGDDVFRYGFQMMIYNVYIVYYILILSQCFGFILAIAEIYAFVLTNSCPGNSVKLQCPKSRKRAPLSSAEVLVYQFSLF